MAAEPCCAKALSMSLSYLYWLRRLHFSARNSYEDRVESTLSVAARFAQDFHNIINFHRFTKGVTLVM